MHACMLVVERLQSLKRPIAALILMVIKAEFIEEVSVDQVVLGEEIDRLLID